jgi:hypothetical protein
MVSVIYKKRALPLMWVVRKGKKGHFQESMHIELIQAVHEHRFSWSEQDPKFQINI